MGRVNRFKDTLRSRGELPLAIVHNGKDGLLQVTTRFNYQGKEFDQVWYSYLSTGSPSLLTMTTLCDAFNTAHEVDLMPHLGSDLLYLGCKCRDLSPGSTQEVEDLYDIPIAGGSTFVAANAFTAIGLNLNTNLRGRAFNGKKRVPGVVSADFLGGVLTVSAQAWAATVFPNFLTQVNSGAPKLVVASFVYHKTARLVPLTTAVVSLDFELYVTTQSSRKLDAA